MTKMLRYSITSALEQVIDGYFFISPLYLKSREHAVLWQTQGLLNSALFGRLGLFLGVPTQQMGGTSYGLLIVTIDSVFHIERNIV